MKKGLIQEAFRLQQLAGLAPINEMFNGPTVEEFVSDLYPEADASQQAKLVNIYKEQMSNEGTSDVAEFFAELQDSSDPNAIIDLQDLDQYKGY